MKAATAPTPEWRAVFDIEGLIPGLLATRSDDVLAVVEARYRTLLKDTHSIGEASELHAAYAAAVAELAPEGNNEVRALAARFDRLSPRTKQVIAAIAVGLEREDVAAELGMNIKTYDTHRRRALLQLGAANNVTLTRMAILCGFASMHDEASLCRTDKARGRGQPSQRKARR